MGKDRATGGAAIMKGTNELRFCHSQMNAVLQEWVDKNIPQPAFVDKVSEGNNEFIVNITDKQPEWPKTTP